MTTADVANRMLEVLTAHHVPQAYGFVNARYAETNVGLGAVLDTWAAQHPLGNHTYSHVDLNLVGPDAFIRQIQQNEPMLRRHDPDFRWRAFRYPYLHSGSTLAERSTVESFLLASGYFVAPVTIAAEDWVFNEPYVRCQNADRTDDIRVMRQMFLATFQNAMRAAHELGQTLTGRTVSQVLLIHFGAVDAAFLDGLLSALEGDGARWITLEEAARDPIYRVDQGDTLVDGWPWLQRVARSRSIPVPQYHPPGPIPSCD